MWAAAVLSCALLLLHNTAAELHYSLVTPYMLKANNTQKICILVVDAPEATPLNVYFEYQSFSSPVSIFNEALPAGRTSKCSDVPIPIVQKADIGYLSVELGELRERKSLVVNGIKPFCVGQMAMPIYQAGQNVACRILCLDAKFMPFSAKVSLFEVLDPNGNRLMQQKNVDSQRPFWTFSYLLTDDAPPGYYQMIAEMSPDMNIFMSFEVRQFVLPKFQTILTAPSSVSLLDKTMTVSVSGAYTYGQSLVADVRFSICRKPNSWQGDETCNLSKDGYCVTITGNIKKLKPLGKLFVGWRIRQYSFTFIPTDSRSNLDSTTDDIKKHMNFENSSPPADRPSENRQLGPLALGAGTFVVPFQKGNNVQLGPDGTMNATVDLLQFQLARNGLDMSIITEVVITENQTDVQETKTAYTWISRQMPIPYFDYQLTKSYYKRGINATGSLTLNDNNNQPMPNRDISLIVKYETVAECKTDEKGNCPFSFDTSKYVDDQLIIEAVYSEKEQCYESTNRWYGSTNPKQYLTRYFSPSGSFVQIQPIVGQQNCGQTLSIHVDYALNLTAVAPNGAVTTVSFTFMIQGKSELKQQGQVDVTLGSGGRGSFSFPVTVTAEFAPSARALVILLLSTGELVADTQSFQVERCFENQVTLQYSTDKARPGSPVNLNVNAAPNSYCGIRAFDESMNILSGGQGQSMGDDVYNRMPYPQMWGAYAEGFDLRDSNQPCINPPNILAGGIPYEVKDVSSDQSVAADFENSGIRLICSRDPRKPIVCPKPVTCQETTVNPVPMRESVTTLSFAKADGLGGGGAGGALVVTVRQYFPNLWKYEDVTTDSDGKASISATLPDTITKWITDAFCISDGKGFGVSNGSVAIIGFQDFFTDLTMPVLIVRGEEFVMKGTAYNYLPECTQINLELADSNQYSTAPVSVENGNCICENERTTRAWSFNALSLGKINISLTAATNSDNNCPGDKGSVTYRDTVTRALLVEAEGLKRQETQSSLICTKAGPVTEPINVNLPENLVNDSAGAIVTCIGDPLGISMRNLGDLAQMPTGCGEQTLSSMSANIAIYKYLNSTGRLDEETRSKILTNLIGGSTRMLQFMSSRGCVSTWSRSYRSDDAYCNKWLTVRTYGTFVEVKNIGVFIDDKLPSQMESYILSEQDRTSGAFYSDGRSYINIANTNYSYTAFAALQFVKAGHNVTHPFVRDAFFYLDNLSESETSDDTLGQVLACNAYAVAGNKEKQNALLDKLYAKAVEDGGGLALKSCRVQISPYYYSFRRPACTGDILLTSLFLSCSLEREDLSAADLSRAATIGKWIGGQMNANGGFSSTFDTPFSLEAMAKFQALTYTKDATNTVTIKFGDTQVHQFTVNADNNLLLQRADLPTVPGVYTAEVTGNGCVFCQTTLRYNVMPENMESSFDLKVWTSPDTCENGDVAQFDITCNTSYIGKKDSSNMAIMDVKLPSGHRATESSLNALIEKGIVQMYDTKTQGHVVVYFNDITKNTTSVTFSVERLTKVENLKPSTILMYSYYDKENEVAVASYRHPCCSPSTAE